MKRLLYGILWGLLVGGSVAVLITFTMAHEQRREEREVFLQDTRDELEYERQLEYGELKHERQLEYLHLTRHFLEELEMTKANWRFEIGEVHLRLIREIVEDAVTGLVNDQEPLQRLKRETR